MNRKFIILLIALTLISITAVCASENATDVVSEETIGEVDADSLQAVDEGEGEPVLANASVDEPVEKAASKITSSKVTGYESFKTSATFVLTSDNKPLASKKISIKIDGVTYNKTTNKDGKVTLSLNLKKGTYNTEFSYGGDNTTNSSKGKSTIVIKEPTKTKLKIGDKDINYRQGSKCLFYVKLLTRDDKPIKNQMVTIKVAGKTYKVKTNKKGIAKIYLNLKKGKRTVKYSFKKNAPYLSSSGSFKIKVRAKIAKGNGYWLWPKHMHSVSLKSLASKGTKHILLHVQAISVYGKSSVVSFIKKAHKYGMKVHLWMQVCCIGETWTSPENKDGSIKYGFLNSKINEAKRYAKIKGVDGIHFDYVRFGGTAHLYKHPEKPLNYFAKKASTAIHKIKPNCIVSAALMPEPSAMLYYYGQDVPAMSKYMDVLIPMVYKGNYHQNTKWIKSVTNTFVKQSNGAQLWTGLQSYVSDDNTQKLSQKALLKDAKAAKDGGAKGVVLFRIGISCNFNFKKVF